MMNSTTVPFFIYAVVNIPFIVSAVTENALILVSFARTPSLLSPSNVLLIGLALSDLSVGLIIQPLYVARVLYSPVHGNKGILATLVNYLTTFFCAVSFQNVTLLSIDRFLALHLHLRYNEFVTVTRVSYLLGVFWICNGVFSYIMLNFPGYFDYISAPFACVCLVLNAILYFKEYLVVRRHQQ